MAELELIEVHKRFKDVAAVHHLDLQVEKGEFFSLLGPSGCGKTTTLRMIAGFLHPTAGEIRIQGQNVVALPPERRNIGIVFQNYAIFPHMTVSKNIAFGLRLRQVAGQALRQQVQGALEQVGLVGYEKRYPRELSGGEQQRVALARVLVTKPRILLLDEPLSALDKKLREEMKFWIKDLQHQLGITSIYVTHDQGEALTMSDRIAVMNRGRIEQIGTPREIYESPQTKFVADFIGESNMLQGEVVAVEGAHVRVEVGGLTILAAKADGVADGQPVWLVVRPESVLIGQRAKQLAVNQFEGVLKSEVYQGPLIRYTLTLGSRHTIVAQLQNTSDRESYTPGDRVSVGWSPDSAAILAQ